jgi:drug/metabolite transporter (DMT)-like permease
VSVGSLLLIALFTACSIGGQLLFKHAMDDAHSRRKSVLTLTGGIAVMGVGFFVWQGLLARFELSFLYPFEALDQLFVLPAAAFFLREKITAQLWVGVLLIVGGVLLVAAS